MPGEEPGGLFELIESGVPDADTSKRMAAEAKAFKQAGTEGKFAVDPEHGKHLVKQINKALDRLSDVHFDNRQLEQALKLGASPDGKRVSDFFQWAAGSDEGCLGWAHELGRQALIDTRDGVQACMKHYRAAEQDAEDRMRGANHDV